MYYLRLKPFKKFKGLYVPGVPHSNNNQRSIFSKTFSQVSGIIHNYLGIENKDENIFFLLVESHKSGLLDTIAVGSLFLILLIYRNC